MSSRHRPITAAAAASVLLALWFVPSASGEEAAPAGVNVPASASVGLASDPAPSDGGTEADTGAADATDDGTAAGPSTGAQDTVGAQDGTDTTTTAETAGTGDRELYLADTGSFDSTPYVTGGLLFLGIGAALVLNSTRRAQSIAD